MLPAMLGVFIIVHKTADIVIFVITEVQRPNFGQLWKVALCCIVKTLPAYVPNMKQQRLNEVLQKEQTARRH